jgi:Txe/YoeB family toxin of Txe-Axe toxin-antitoxin module
MRTLRDNPYEQSQGFERLTGNLKGFCSRQISLKHRVLYRVLPNVEVAKDECGNLYEGIVPVYRAWGHNYRNPVT